jgi:hypothetical protein
MEGTMTLKTFIALALAVVALPIATAQAADTVTTGSAAQATSGVTPGQQNALRSAKLYLSTMAFSRKGLVRQLRYEGYTVSEAKYGVAKCHANWSYQAYRMAKQYLSNMPFSRSGLIKQLEYEGFTAG